MKKKQRARQSALFRLADSLVQFEPSAHSVFLCPICMRRVPLTLAKEISEAHIVPRSAGGKLTTFMCSRCNNAFGATRDKWFGEYLHLRASNKSVFDTRQQAGYFRIGEDRVGGRFERTEDGGINFYIFRDKTSPQVLAALKGKASSPALTVAIPMPLMENRALLPIGFLTAAYLLCFREFGYSWALQKHLDPLRDVLLDRPSNLQANKLVHILKSSYFARPWIGVGALKGNQHLIAGIGDHVVFLPTIGHPEACRALPSDLGNTTVDDCVAFSSNAPYYKTPLGVLYGSHLLICPDVMLNPTSSGRFIMYVPGNAVPRELRRVGEDEANMLRSTDEVALLKIALDNV